MPPSTRLAVRLLGFCSGPACAHTSLTNRHSATSNATVAVPASSRARARIGAGRRGKGVASRFLTAASGPLYAAEPVFLRSHRIPSVHERSMSCGDISVSSSQYARQCGQSRPSPLSASAADRHRTRPQAVPDSGCVRLRHCDREQAATGCAPCSNATIKSATDIHSSDAREPDLESDVGAQSERSGVPPADQFARRVSVGQRPLQPPAPWAQRDLRDRSRDERECACAELHPPCGHAPSL